MTNNNTITAQVACEAIINNPTAYEYRTVLAVLHAARDAGVASLYIGGVEEVERSMVDEFN